MKLMSKVAELVLGAETEASARPCEGPAYTEWGCYARRNAWRTCYYDYCDKRKYCGSWHTTNEPCN